MYCARAGSYVDKPSSWQNTEVILKFIVQMYLAVCFKVSHICVFLHKLCVNKLMVNIYTL